MTRGQQKSKRLGRVWETACVRLLTARFPSACRYGSVNGRNDKGDIANVPWTWQCKNLAQLGPARLGQIMDETSCQAARAGKRYFGIALKRRGFPADQGFFIMPLSMAAELMEKTKSDESETTVADRPGA